jgi:pimeloyl-ACP methyl ester carboxylesterase
MDDGVELEVDARGAGPLLLLVHGFGGAKEDFADHVDALAETHRVVTFDHRGHGESDKPDDPAAYSLARLAADTLAVAASQGQEPFRLLGHSMGGMVARRIVLTEPDRVDALVLMDTAAGPVGALDPDMIEAGAEIALRDGMPALKRVMDEFTPLDTPAYRRLLAERPDYQAFQDRKFAALSAVMWATMVREIRDQPDDLAALASVTAPALVIVGELDAPFFEPCQAMAATIPGARLAVIEGAGHSPQFENATDWRRALTDFLAELPARSDVAG